MRDSADPGGVRLPADEAAYLAGLGGVVDPETGPGSKDYDRLVAEQAAIDSGRFMTAEETAAALGIDKEDLGARVANHVVLAQLVSGMELFPKWQFGDDSMRALAHLAEVIDALRPGVSPFEVAGVMATPQVSLQLHGVAVSPQHWLSAGGPVEPVLDLLQYDCE